jgi:predicted ester cyclase
MSTEENEAIVRYVFEGVNEKNLAFIEEVMAPNFLSHALPPGMPPTRESHKQALNMLFTAFPDYHITIEDIITNANKAAARLTVRGTHQGDFFGIDEGKLVEYWLIADNLSLLQQLRTQPM